MTNDELRTLIRAEVRSQLASAMSEIGTILAGPVPTEDPPHPVLAMSIAEAVALIAGLDSGMAVEFIIEAELENPAGARRSVLDSARIRLDELRMQPL